MLISSIIIAGSGSGMMSQRKLHDCLLYKAQKANLSKHITVGTHSWNIVSSSDSSICSYNRNFYCPAGIQDPQAESGCRNQFVSPKSQRCTVAALSHVYSQTAVYLDNSKLEELYFAASLTMPRPQAWHFKTMLLLCAASTMLKSMPRASLKKLWARHSR